MKSAIVQITFRAALAVAVLAPAWAMAASLDHIHLIVDDPKAGVEWYAKHFGGTVPDGTTDTVLFGETVVKFKTSEAEVEGSRGSAFDHISFSVPNVQAKMDELGEAGIVVIRWGFHAKNTEAIAGVFLDPWGTRIEILNDDELLGFHHLHVKTRDPIGTAKWYSEVFGAEIGGYKNTTQFKTLRFGDMYIFVQRAIRPVVPTIDRSIDHINMKLTNFDAEIERLKALDVTFLQEAHQAEVYRRARIEGPDGATIELVSAKPGK
jgi:catechol 2,3-dioxygenase-like lactoylglutathione lyase family enzyme